MCGASIKQQRICGGKRNKLVFYSSFVCFEDQNLAEFRNKRTRCRYYVFSCVLCIKISRIISLSLSLFLSLSLALLKIFSLPLLFLYFFTSFFISFSLSLSLYNVISRSYFFYLLLLGSFSRFHFAQLLGHHEGQLDRLTRVQARVAVG